MFLVCAVLVNLAFLLYSFLVVGEICEHFWAEACSLQGRLLYGNIVIWIVGAFQSLR